MCDALQLSWMAWRGPQEQDKGMLQFPPVYRAAQTVFILSVGMWKDEFGSSLSTLNTTDCPQETLLTFCAHVLPSPCFAWLQCSISDSNWFPFPNYSAVDVNSSWEIWAVLLLNTPAPPLHPSIAWVPGAMVSQRLTVRWRGPQAAGIPNALRGEEQRLCGVRDKVFNCRDMLSPLTIWVALAWPR